MGDNLNNAATGAAIVASACRAHFRTEEEGERYDLSQRLADLIEQREATLAADPAKTAELEEEMARCVERLEALPSEDVAEAA